ncbi:MAG: phage baseplate assembly protein V [Myxococcota bacterium]
MKTTQPTSASHHHLAEVVSVGDVSSKGKIRVRLLTHDGSATQNAPIDARLCVPFAGGDRGAFMVPDVGDEVLVAFVGGDPRQAVVVGGMWNGQNTPGEDIQGDRVDRWSFIGKKGTRIAIVEEGGGARIELQARSGRSSKASCVIDRNGSIRLYAGGTTLVLDGAGMRLETSGACDLQSTAMTVTAATMTVDTAFTSFSGFVDVSGPVQSPAILGQSYTPGAGNVW